MIQSIKTMLTALAILTTANTAFAQMDERQYASVRGWNVIAAFEQGIFQGCAMFRPGTAFDLMLAQNSGGIWELGFPTNAPFGSPVLLDMDLDRYSDVLQGSSNGVWAFSEVTPTWVQSLATGNSLTVTMEGRTHSVSLRGTTAAILKAKECVQRQGIRAAAAAPTTAPVTAPIESDAARMGAACPAYGTYQSPNVQDWGDVEFTNNSAQALTIYWIDFDGRNVEMAGLLPGESASFTSNAGHHWIAKDFDGTCHGGLLTLALGENKIPLY